MEQFLFFFLLHQWAVSVFIKLNHLTEEHSTIRTWAANIKNRPLGDFFYGALECVSPCLESHIGLLLSIPIVVYKTIELVYSDFDFYFIGSNWYYFLFGWMAAGLSIVIDKLKKQDDILH